MSGAAPLVATPAGVGEPTVNAVNVEVAIDPPCSACRVHNPLSVAAPISRVRCERFPWVGSAPHRFR
jgi:hypothetical protein